MGGGRVRTGAGTAGRPRRSRPTPCTSSTERTRGVTTWPDTRARHERPLERASFLLGPIPPGRAPPAAVRRRPETESRRAARLSRGQRPTREPRLSPAASVSPAFPSRDAIAPPFSEADALLRFRLLAPSLAENRLAAPPRPGEPPSLQPPPTLEISSSEYSDYTHQVASKVGNRSPCASRSPQLRSTRTGDKTHSRRCVPKQRLRPSQGEDRGPPVEALHREASAREEGRRPSRGGGRQGE